MTVDRAVGELGAHAASALPCRSAACVTLMSLVLVAGSSSAATDHEGNPAQLNGDVTWLYNDNVTRAQRDVDIADDNAVEGNLSLSWSTPGLQGQSFSFAMSGKAVKFDRFDGLDHAELAFEGAYRVQFARGFFAPFYELSAKAATLEHESALREGYQFELGAMATKRLTDRLTGRTGLRWTRRGAEEGSVFDLERANVFVNVDWRLTSGSLAYATWIGSTGDVVSTAQPTFTIVDNAEAIEPDTAFGGAEANRFAYRLDADVHILTLGVNISLGPSTSLDLSVEGLTAEAVAGIEYQRGIGRISLLHRF